ncbi:N-alpha-acetyltransferase 80 [Zerene cesonia]|uniref:N-alpha-acetyltransferase 80 n=1 Tax=Zerene cesonia TaxID=33412 RepID=UPI0018E50B2C|nr:N-alpha-acetyltransferase 80 [Zerene cesonia]
MDYDNLKIIALHKHPEFLEACCEMINDEWPRSRTARMMSLTASCDELPTSLILIDDQFHLLGHAKLTSLPSVPDSCFIETVVIKKDMRGKRLGSFLMRQVEQYCKSVLNLKMLHLSTKGQEDFYAKLGYTVCAPVSIYGTVVRTKVESSKRAEKQKSPKSDNAAPPPPPMPIPQNVSETAIKSSKTYMFKHL